MRISTRPNPGLSNWDEKGLELMRISRMELLGGNWPPLNPSTKNCAPLGPATDQPALPSPTGGRPDRRGVVRDLHPLIRWHRHWPTHRPTAARSTAR